MHGELHRPETPLVLAAHVKDYIYWLYYQYLLITCSYVLEPWEQSMFHTITVTVFAMVVYTAYVFVPIHCMLHQGKIIQ
uniref:Serine palmitoyltransferase small subunit B n=1 Tax=Anas platyrhynchos platyrhynchos TaxID=8840 RepID=U3I2A0_ANAPP